MSILVEPTDFTKCPNCLRDCLRVAYWDTNLGKVGEVLVVDSFDYDFQRRDFKGRLMVLEYSVAMEARHELKCPRLQTGGDDEEETKPYGGARSKG